MSQKPLRKFKVVKKVLVRDGDQKKIDDLSVGATLLVKDVRRIKKRSVCSAEMSLAEIVQVDDKLMHGFCHTHDFRGNALMKEVSMISEGDIKIDEKQQIQPAAVLARVQVLAENVNQSQLRELVRALKTVSYMKGDIIMKEGDKGTELFILCKGRAQISEKDLELGVLIPGDYIGEEIASNFEQPVQWVHTVTAITEVICYVASQEMFKAVLNKEENHDLLGDPRVAFSTKRVPRKDRLKWSTIHPEGKQIDFILNAVKDTTMFSGLNEDECRAVVKQMTLRLVAPNTEVIKQGDLGGVHFYVIARGEFQISIDGKELYTFDAGQCFGERALIQNAPRAASIECLALSRLWVLHRDDYRDTVAAEAQKGIEELVSFLSKLEIFKVFNRDNLITLAETFELKIYESGTNVFRQNDEADRFYLIKHGHAFMSKKDKHGTLVKTATFSEGSYFGELALTTGTPRTATIRAKTDLTCLELTKKDFDSLLKPLSLLFKKNPEEYEIITSTIYKETPGKFVEQKVDVIQPRVTTPLEHLVKLGLLGKGAFGLVTLVQDARSRKTYALKAIRKADIVKRDQGQHIVNEKNIQMRLKTPFCVELFRTYKDKYRIYFLLEACTGGDIFALLRKRRRFSEKGARFYAACVISAFDHMHARDIIYRDLKPENVVIHSTGYGKLTDFGFAKKVRDKTNTVCGTPDYIAPEVIIGVGHGRAVDFWALGIFVYECINGVAPFYSKKDMDCYKKILRSPVRFTKRMSVESQQFVTELLKKKPSRRLGIRKGDVIHSQEFFTKRGWNWKAFLNLNLKAPYPPKKVVLKDSNIARYKAFDKDIECAPQEFEKSF